MFGGASIVNFSSARAHSNVVAAKGYAKVRNGPVRCTSRYVRALRGMARYVRALRGMPRYGKGCNGVRQNTERAAKGYAKVQNLLSQY